MREHKVHIYEHNMFNFFSQKTLCNRRIMFLKKIPFTIDEQIFKTKNVPWCLVCKMLFNANHSYKFKKELK
jgi:hypothetical protein